MAEVAVVVIAPGRGEIEAVDQRDIVGRTHQRDAQFGKGRFDVAGAEFSGAMATFWYVSLLGAVTLILLMAVLAADREAKLATRQPDSGPSKVALALLSLSLPIPN